MKADYILANPPFNSSEWGGGELKDDARWKYGIPPAGNANFAWVQHFIAAMFLHLGAMSGQRQWRRMKRLSRRRCEG
jgi:hypothetical protein